MTTTSRWRAPDKRDVHLAASILGQTAPTLAEAGPAARWPGTVTSIGTAMTVNPQALGWFGEASNSLTTLPESSMDFVNDRYVFRNTEAVRGFLREHPFLFPLLMTAHSWIERVFGAGTIVYLEVFSYPGAPQDQGLFALIGTWKDPIGALGALSSFRRLWWLDALAQAKHKLTFDIEYL